MKEYELEEEQSMSIQDAEVENTQLNSDTENQAQLEGNDQEPGEEKEEKAKREMFLRSPFLLVGLLIAAVASVFILSKGQSGKELILHTAYIAGFVVYAIFYFVSQKALPKEIVIKQRAKRFLYDIADCLFTVLVAFVLAIFVLDCFKISVVSGESMDNTLHDGQKLILGMHTYDFKSIERGDIVVCYAEQLNESIVKRVIGRPGDHLVIEDNKVYINDELLEENYIKAPMKTEDLDVEIPEGKLFVMGDNRNESGDSRWDAVGLIDIEEDLQGKIILESLFGID